MSTTSIAVRETPFVVQLLRRADDALILGHRLSEWTGRAPTLDVLREHCRAHIAAYKTPREVILVDEVPRLPNGKPDYRTAQSQAHERTVVS